MVGRKVIQDSDDEDDALPTVDFSAMNPDHALDISSSSSKSLQQSNMPSTGSTGKLTIFLLPLHGVATN